jgi:uncharacterized membrane protein
LACILAAPLALAGCFRDNAMAAPKPILVEGCLTDVAYEPARRLVSLYCADCHAKAGNHESHKDAWGFAIRLDTYAEWVEGARHLKERLDPAVAAEQDPPLDAMPLLAFKFQPTQAERDTLLDWLRRDSPNTASGFAE